SKYVTVRDRAAFDAATPAEVKTKDGEALRTRRHVKSEAPQRGFFERLRAVVGSDWLRRAFTVLLIAALIGLAWSTYYYFAEKRIARIPDIPGIGGKEGVIGGGALNVNLRSEPNGSVVAVLSANSHVRVLEERGNWVRVRVLTWVGGAPPNAP